MNVLVNDISYTSSQSFRPSAAALTNSSTKRVELKGSVSVGEAKEEVKIGSHKYQQMFSRTTKALVWGMQARAVQSMLDFDFICR